MRVGVLGLGAVGARVARQLMASNGVSRLVVRDRQPVRVESVLRSLGEGATADTEQTGIIPDLDVVVLALPAGRHAAVARAFLQAGTDVVSVSDSQADVHRLLELDGLAEGRGRTLIVGAGFAPGLSCLLTRHAADLFDEVDEIQIAKMGTGGPACARQHHSALGSDSREWGEEGFTNRPGGSGRVLAWFPDPIGARDCYRAAMGDAVLLHRSFPGARRITVRVAATRRDRMTSRLPMMRRPHPEGGPGGIRTEVWGRRGLERDVKIYGSMDRPGIAAGAVAAVSALWIGEGRLPRAGAYGLGEVGEPARFLADLEGRGVRAAVYKG